MLKGDYEILCWKGCGDDLHNVARKIRHEVFVDAQNVDEELEYEGDEDSTHYLLKINGKAIATARYRLTDRGVKLERFAVLPSERNRGIGTVLLKHILSELKPYAGIIYLHSQLRAVPYYKRSGFVEEGEHFFEADIEHVKMILNQRLYSSHP